MIVADTSAWIEFLRGTSHPARFALSELIHAGTEIAVTEVVVMEMLAGARSRSELGDLRSRFLAYPLLHLRGLSDFEEAARLYRVCRSRGETVRSLLDCLVAVPTIRAGAQLLHKNADFDVIARHTDLELYPV